MTQTEYRRPGLVPGDGNGLVKRAIAERANRLGLQVLLMKTVRNNIPTYLFWRDGEALGHIQANGGAWLAGFESGNAAFRWQPLAGGAR